MKILIAGLDYSGALDGVRPLTVVRKLNAPSLCRFWVSLPALSGGTGLAQPQRNEAVAVIGDDGTVYFTGYLAVSPLAEYAGLGLMGPVYRLALEAVSDELLLDTQLLPPSAGSTGATAAQLVRGLVTRTGIATGGAGNPGLAGVALTTTLGEFVPEPGASWSELAGQVAGEARAAYRAVGGQLLLNSVGSTVHALNEADGTLALGNLSLTAEGLRALANDVTVCGAEEPVAYVTEYFLGDGATLVFPLAGVPYMGTTAAEKIIWELFQEAAIDLRVWGFAGSESVFSLTSAGLQVDGGSGVDGGAALVWNDRVEAGGTLLLEAVGVNLSPGSSGTIAGVYNGPVLAAECVAGFAVSSATGTGVVSVSPLVLGLVAGPAYVLDATQQYTLRVRLHCPEVERTTQSYRISGDAGLVEFGGGGAVAAGRVLMDVQEFVDGVAGTPVVLYDGAVANLPASFTVAATSSVNLIGTMRSFFLKGLGTGWVSSTPAGGAARTRRVGTLADGGECHLLRTGSLTFYTGFAPGVGETVAVNYRTVGRAVGRAVNAASQAALVAAGSPATAAWIGTVTRPAARSSLDCRNAAQALVTAAASVSAAWSGSYKTTNVALNQGRTGGGVVLVDVWPGDALLLNASSLPVAGGGVLDTQVVVRKVTLSYGSSQPDVVQYAIEFANDWANDLSVKTSKTVPADAWLPAVGGPTYLANLNGLAVTAFSATAVSVAANATPPAGGGFEVRRRDFSFAPGQDADLVLRSAVANFDIPRATEADRFYVRMYDGSSPPNYSEFSAGVFLNIPL